MIKRSIPWYRQPPCLVDLNSEYARYVNSARIWNLPPTFAKEVTPTKLNAYTKVGTITTSILAIGPGLGVKGDGSTGSYLRSIANLAPQAMWMVVQFVANTVNVTKNGVYVLGSTSAGANSCNVGVYSGSGAVSNIIGIFKSDDTTTNSIIKQGPVPIAGQLYTVILVAPSALKADAYLYINGEKYTDDAAGSTDVTLGGTALGKEAVCAFKRGGDFDGPINFGNDTILFTARGLGQIPEPLARDISINPYMLLQKQQRSIYVSVAGGQVDYSLTCSAGAYTYTGQSASLSVAHSLSCAAGSYSYSGVSTTLAVAHNLVCATGAYTYSGVSAALPVSRSLSCASGSYTYSGVAATLTVRHGLSCDAGSYTYAGVAATLTYIPGDGTVDYVLTCAAGAYAYSGQAATLSVNHSLTCAAGAYTYSGVSTSLQVDHRLTCDVGAYAYTGQNATLSVKRSLACATGSYDYIGSTATLDYLSGAASINYVLTCAAGAYTYAGQSATLTVVGSWAGEPFNFSSPITRAFDFSSSITKTLAFDSSI